MDAGRKAIKQSIKDVPLNSLEKTHKEEVELEESNDKKDAVSHAPVAPTIPRKYIKGTPEHKAYKASKQKSHVGMPTGKYNEEANFDEEGNLMAEKKTYTQFVEQLLEYTPGPGGVTKVKGRSYGAQYHDPEGDDDADNKPKAKPAADAPKRGRGRPAGSKSGANHKVTTGKSSGGADYTGYKLHLPNTNR